MDESIDRLTFEEAMRALEEVVSRVEGDGLGLDETLRLFERGTQLATRCSMLLDQAELRVFELTQAGDGAPSLD